MRAFANCTTLTYFVFFAWRGGGRAVDASRGGAAWRELGWERVSTWLAIESFGTMGEGSPSIAKTRKKRYKKSLFRNNHPSSAGQLGKRRSLVIPHISRLDADQTLHLSSGNGTILQPHLLLQAHALRSVQQKLIIFPFVFSKIHIYSLYILPVFVRETKDLI